MSLTEGHKKPNIKDYKRFERFYFIKIQSKQQTLKGPGLILLVLHISVFQDRTNRRALNMLEKRLKKF